MTEPKTVTARIALAVGPDGGWFASGLADDGDGAMDCVVESVSAGEARYWVTATLPIPEAREIAGTVEAADHA